ncbi:MAG: hypothetical protein ACRD4M_00255 [Candidatus Acidiferrales bacterium]
MDIAIIASLAMSREEHSPQKRENELRVLRALCGDSLGVPEREDLTRKLENYEWSEEEHRVVFQAILSLRRADAASLREHLPGAATRMGFPDIFWEDYFVAGPGENMRFPELLRFLREG